MGINLYIYKVERNGDQVVSSAKSDVPFDSAKHSGDREFAGSHDLFTHFYDKDSEYAFYRPISFEKTRNWVTENIEPEGNKERLLSILDVMEKDETLYFNTSF